MASAAPNLITAEARHGGLFARHVDELAWSSAGRPGLRLRMVYGDRERGRFLGLVAFDPLTRSGLHQHLGVASSFFLAGSLDDYGGPMRQGFGINLAGATHDAISYEGCLLASRLEAPVIYPEETPSELDLHTGSQRGAIVNPRPEDPPDLNIPLEAVRPLPTLLPGVSRRIVFDYAGTGTDRRCANLSLLPGARIPAFSTSAPLDLFLIAGDLWVRPASGPAVVQEASAFFVIEPGARVTLGSRYGARVIAWSEAPVRWVDGEGAEPFGF